MNQKKLSGIGNVYSDEILFQAGVHPRCPLTSLSEEARDAIYDSLHTVMDTALECEADPSQFPSTFLTPHRSSGTGRSGDEGEMRTGDGWELVTTKVGGRTCYFAPERQLPCQ